jgi:hypothetical protein
LSASASRKGESDQTELLIERIESGARLVRNLKNPPFRSVVSV